MQSFFRWSAVIVLAEIRDSVRDAVRRELRQGFRPEFLNRVDEIVHFKPRSRAKVKSIVGLLVFDIDKRLSRRSISICWNKEDLGFITEGGYDPASVTRPLKRFPQRLLETRLAWSLIGGELSEGSLLEGRVKDWSLDTVTL